jgi:hypothetical protein
MTQLQREEHKSVSRAKQQKFLILSGKAVDQPEHHNNHQRRGNNHISRRSHPSRRFLASQSSHAHHGRHCHWHQADGRQRLGRDDAGGDQEGESRDNGDNGHNAKGAVWAAIGSARRALHVFRLCLELGEQ